MKANELMIGDWVVYNGDVDYINPIKIEGMDIATGMCVTTDRDDVGFDGVWPIPLTAEILEKNGFENDFYHDESVADYHFVRLEGYSYREEFSLVQWCNGELNVVNDLIGEVKIHCENVHELQHALRLCGIEKEIMI